MSHSCLPIALTLIMRSCVYAVVKMPINSLVVPKVHFPFNCSDCYHMIQSSEIELCDILTSEKIWIWFSIKFWSFTIIKQKEYNLPQFAVADKCDHLLALHLCTSLVSLAFNSTAGITWRDLCQQYVWLWMIKILLKIKFRFFPMWGCHKAQFHWTGSCDNSHCSWRENVL